MTRVVVVDLLCNSPFYSGALTGALHDAGADAELASPRFYLEPDALDPYPRAPWILDLVDRINRPRPVRLAVRTVEIAFNAARLVGRILRRRYDVVHVQWIPLETRSTMFMRVLRAACDRSGTLLVLTAHNAMPHDDPGARRDVIRRNRNRAHLVMALADHVANELVTEVGVRAPIVTVPHGPLFADRPLPDRESAAGRLAWSAGPTVLYLGLIRAYKGVDLLADAWPAVLGTVPDAKLLVVGKVLDPSVRGDLERLRAMPRVTVVEAYVPVSRMLDSYAVSDVVVFPYHRISQSAGLMTAAGLGRPAVITPVDGLVEQAATLTSAIVADDADGPAVARAVIESLRRHDEQQVAADRDRVAIADSAAGWPAVARATLGAYRVAIDGRRGTATARR